MRWICSQIGAREHYAIPRVLHRAGKLESLYTDFWANKFWRQAGDVLGGSRFVTRYHEELAEARVESFHLATMVDSALGGIGNGNPYDGFLTLGTDFGRSVEASLMRKKRMNWSQIIFFGYDTGFLESARWLKARGGKSIVCQMDPSRVEVDLVKEEEKLWPGWAKRSLTVPEAYFQRREKEWAVADLVMVNSEWTKAALIQQGVPESKLIIVPLAYEALGSQEGGDRRSEVRGQRSEVRDRRSEIGGQRSEIGGQPVHVLFLGQVNLRKGIQYLIQAAKLLQNEPVQFDIVGPLGISEEAVQSAPPNMIFHGPISRDRAPEFFSNADLFVLPTLSDGFALTQLEAMAYGIPVIATPNCGAVVTDGVDGIIVAARSSEEIYQAIKTLLSQPEKLDSMRVASRMKAREYGLQRLRHHLNMMEEMLEKKGG